MKVIKVIANKNFEPRIPWTKIAVLFLLMDRFHAPEWVWGSMAVLVVLLIMLVIKMKATNEYKPVDIFENQNNK